MVQMRALHAAAGVKPEATEKAAAVSTLRLLLIVDENVKKVVSVPDDIDIKRLREQLAANTFGMNPEATGVKCYDKEFEEWVLIPDDFLPTNKERLQVIPVDKVS